MARLLVVDDDPAIGKFVRRGLEAEGHMVAVTANAPTAVRLAQDTRAEVAIVDIVMPEIDGRSLLPLLLPARPGLRVIMLSVDADVSTRVDCFDGGAADFVPKPFSIREAGRTSAGASRPGQRQPAEPGALRVGDVALDRIRRTVHVRGTAIHLSNREFSVLQHLMSRAGTGVHPRAVVVRGLGLLLRSGHERRRRVRPTSPEPPGSRQRRQPLVHPDDPQRRLHRGPRLTAAPWHRAGSRRGREALASHSPSQMTRPSSRARAYGPNLSS